MPLNSCIILAQISREVLLLGLALPVAAAVGFAFGILYERWYQAAALQRYLLFRIETDARSWM